MVKKLILSHRLTKSHAALAEMNMNEVNERAGFSPNYIYRLFGRDNIQLDTINRIAWALGVRALDIMEEVEVEDYLELEESSNTQAKAPPQAEKIFA